MALPCRNLFDQMETEKNRMERCWDLADGRQWRLTEIGVGVTSACTLCAGHTKTGKIAAAIASCLTCTKGLAGFVSGLFDYSTFLNTCNQQDLRAEAAAKRYRDCSAKHKDVLKAAAARANS